MILLLLTSESSPEDTENPPNMLIDTSSSGNTEIIAAPSSGFIRVHGYVLVAAGSVNVKWTDGANNDYTGPMPMVAGNAIVAPNDRDGWFDLPPQCNLVLNLSGAVAVGGHVKHSIVGN